MRTLELTASSIMAALVCVATLFFIVPIPATQGYFNVGDAMIVIAAIVFGPMVGAVAGGVGAALADILAGYSYFAPFTLVIKGVEGAIIGIIYTKMKSGFIMKLVIAWIVGGLEMVVGYFITEYLFLGYGNAAFVEIPFNITQMLVAGIVGIPLALALQRVLKYK